MGKPRATNHASEEQAAHTAARTWSRTRGAQQQRAAACSQKEAVRTRRVPRFAQFILTTPKLALFPAPLPYPGRITDLHLCIVVVVVVVCGHTGGEARTAQNQGATRKRERPRALLAATDVRQKCHRGGRLGDDHPRRPWLGPISERGHPRDARRLCAPRGRRSCRRYSSS